MRSLMEPRRQEGDRERRGGKGGQRLIPAMGQDLDGSPPPDPTASHLRSGRRYALQKEIYFWRGGKSPRLSPLVGQMSNIKGQACTGRPWRASTSTESTGTNGLLMIGAAFEPSQEAAAAAAGFQRGMAAAAVRPGLPPTPGLGGMQPTPPPSEHRRVGGWGGEGWGGETAALLTRS